MSTLLKIVNSSLQRAWYVFEQASKTSMSVCFSTISRICRSKASKCYKKDEAWEKYVFMDIQIYIHVRIFIF